MLCILFRFILLLPSRLYSVGGHVLFTKNIAIEFLILNRRLVFLVPLVRSLGCHVHTGIEGEVFKGCFSSIFVLSIYLGGKVRVCWLRVVEFSSVCWGLARKEQLQFHLWEVE